MAVTQHQATRSDESELTPRLKRNLSRNLAAMERHRPSTFAALNSIQPGQSGRYMIQPVNDSPTIFRRDEATADRAVPISLAASTGRGDPIAPYREALSAPTAKALCGIGDGHMLEWLARNTPAVAHNGAGTIYLLEPDLELVLHCMMLRDLSGPEGPIVQSRFHWFVGPQGHSDAQSLLVNEPLLPESGCVVGQGPHAAQITQSWKQVTAHRAAALDADRIAVQQYAESLCASDLAQLFSAAPHRPPRVLLITSRHTTVLQYSTNDAAQAFDELGCETRVLVEREDFHVVREGAVMRAIVEFKPDLIFTIDHLRSEVDGLPNQIPFVCWIQDNLPNLTSSDAGQTVGVRDFVIGGWVRNYVERYGYPQRQCLALRRLTRPTHAPAASSTGEDLVYVSNHSEQPGDRINDLLRQLGTPNVPNAGAIIGAAAQEMVNRYEADQCLRGIEQIRKMVREVAGDLAEDAVRIVAGFLDEFNSTLYRQQAVRWAITIAKQNGLTIGLYGKGWEHHPEFAAFARGVVAYGEPLEQLTQQAKINLQLEPFSPTQHQRLLDGLAAGGFFLSRLRRPDEFAFRNWLKLADQIDPSITTFKQASEQLGPEAIETIRRIQTDLVRERPHLDGVDIVAWLSKPQQRNRFEAMRVAPLPPRYQEIAFLDQSEFESRILTFLNDEPLRREISQQQRAFVEREFSYAGGMRFLLTSIGRLIGEETGPTPQS